VVSFLSGKVLNFCLALARKFQLVEERKFHVRRVSSKLAELRKASRSLTSVNVEGEASGFHCLPSGLFESFLEVAIMVTPSYDRHQNLYNPYIKFSYPDSVTCHQCF
jgi:hypothetical protein